MGEARRRANLGLPPREAKTVKGDSSPRIIPWLPVTQKQRDSFFSLTKRGAWVGIGALVILWLIVRVIGPAAGWWIPADTL